MSDKNKNKKNKDHDEHKEPVIRDKRRVDPETGDIRATPSSAAEDSAAGEGQPAGSAEMASGSVDDTAHPDAAAEHGADADAGADSNADADAELTDGETVANELSAEDQQLLEDASRDLVAEMRDQMLRAQAELVNFRSRVERDRVTNREAVIADVVRSMLPALDDLDRADKHGDIIEGTPLALVAHKISSSFERFGLRKVGEKGEVFDPAFHEAVVHLTDPEAKENTIADVFEPGYILGERVVRAAKVAVSGPTQ
ncbi:molecular chaperone GrpE [Rhodoglobus vestalii]|uniref:Protein GrpE n=1 Tax=Rhodoglobus vestalii TaxID=193384 RepID=A0A8H2K4P7_9MICO|nr:nucleotide exchange factor GrpE [Rhodoglobus vestalii]TQO20115.1 molecular chaperone GrpE [Rhodoglobus vestalii]